MGRRSKTHEAFVSEVESLVGDEYEVLGIYVNTRTKVKIKHVVCNSNSEVYPQNILSGHRCAKCYRNIQKTHKEFVKEVKEMVGGEYEVLGEYVTSKTKIKMKHSICDHEYEVKPTSFLSRKRCPKCYKNPKKNNETFRKDVKKLVDNEYEVLGEYITSKTKIKMKHTTCGNEYEVVPYSFLNGKRCPNCFGTPKKTNESFLEEVKKLVENEYVVLGDYTTNKTKIKMKHTICGNEYEVVPSSFLIGSRCPICNESKGERTVADFLGKNNIESFRQFRDATCVDKIPLPFDFAIKQGNRVAALIEYDGEQHHVVKDFFGGETGLREIQRRDAIKTKYCADNNIPLIRIPYWDYDNIDAILTEKLLPLLKDNADN